MTIGRRHTLQILSAGFFAGGLPAALFALIWIVVSPTLAELPLPNKAIGLFVSFLIVAHFSITSAFMLGKINATTFIVYAGLALTLIGSAWLVWTVHLGIVSGDWEYYGVVAAVATAIQGSLSVLAIYHRTRMPA